MKWGKQVVFCANCGTEQTLTRMSNDHIKSMLCSDQCRQEWEIKYARCILGKDGLRDKP